MGHAAYVDDPVAAARYNLSILHRRVGVGKPEAPAPEKAEVAKN